MTDSENIKRSRIKNSAYSAAERMPIINKSVYIIQARGRSLYKIGHSFDPAKRMQAIQSSCPFPLKLIRAWQTEAAPMIEHRLHAEYEEYRLEGEWFRLFKWQVKEIIARVTELRGKMP